MFDKGFVFEMNTGEYMKKVRKREEIEGLISGSKHSIVQKVEPETGKPLRYSLVFPAYPGNLGNFSNGLFDFEQFDRNTNMITVRGYMNFGIIDQEKLVEPFAQAMKDLAVSIYPLAQPDLGWIDNEKKNPTDNKDVVNLKLSVVSWVNFWGPPYVKKYREDFLANAPGYKTQLIPGGGIFHQLTRNFVAENSAEAKNIRRQVIDYFKAHNLQVKCSAPYSI
jgi:hypothetical protein